MIYYEKPKTVEAIQWHEEQRYNPGFIEWIRDNNIDFMLMCEKEHIIKPDMFYETTGCCRYCGYHYSDHAVMKHETICPGDFIIADLPPYRISEHDFKRKYERRERYP